MARSPDELDADALKAAEERLRLALDSVGDGSWDWNLRTDEVFASDRLYESLGYERADLGPFGDAWIGLLHPEDVPLVQSAIEAHLAGHTRELDCEYRMRTRSGQWRWTQVRGRVIERDEAGEPVRLVGTNLDISLAKRVQLSLDELEGRCRAIVNTAGCIIVVIDADGRVQEWNPAAERIYGWPFEAVRGKDYAEWFLPEAHREPVAAEVARMLAGGEETRNFENPILTRDGNERNVLWNATALRNSEGRPWAVLAVGQDITERRAFERSFQIAVNEKDRALERVRALSIALERCTRCSSVRTADDEWHSLEQHLGIAVSETVCPRCAAD